MSDTTLRDLVLKRLDADTKPEHEWSALVLAALEGPDELAKLLDGPVSFRGAGGRVGGAEESAISAPAPAPPRIAFLRTITVEGFRGIGPKATLDLTPGPGLTLVVGRNGSGKSSFAEGLELLLTGDTYRWRDRRGSGATAGSRRDACGLQPARDPLPVVSKDAGVRPRVNPARCCAQFD
jgi:hypothetical protein